MTSHHREIAEKLIKYWSLISQQRSLGHNEKELQLVVKGYLELLERDRWIPCSERLPNCPEWVDVFVQTWSKDFGMDMDAIPSGSDGESFKKHASHWKPLPPSPEDS